MGVMDLFGDESTPVAGSKFLKGADFDGNGLDLVVVGVEVFTPENADYGVKHTYGTGGIVTRENWLIKNGILQEGQTFKYKFTADELPKELDNGSIGLFFAFKDANPTEGQKVNIKRNKKSNTDIDWTITKI